VTDDQRPSGPRVELRVLTYNIRGLRGGMAGVARVINSARADVVCIQEGPAGWRWRSPAAELARRSGMYVVSGGRPAAGNLLLCAARVDRLSATDHRLSRTPGLAARGCAESLMRVGGVTIGVVGVHFGLRAPERRRHAEEVAAIADRLRAAGAVGVVLGADLNSAPTSAEWEPLLTTLRDTAPPHTDWSTFPAQQPRARIDVVLADPAVEVTACGVLDEGGPPHASDHRPVLAVLQLPQVRPTAWAGQG
jgi:endonuclease/exonuclease/phosphatase family metal-dependent hydrolase